MPMKQASTNSPWVRKSLPFDPTFEATVLRMTVKQLKGATLKLAKSPHNGPFFAVIYLKATSRAASNTVFCVPKDGNTLAFTFAYAPKFKTQIERIIGKDGQILKSLYAREKLLKNYQEQFGSNFTYTRHQEGKQYTLTIVPQRDNGRIGRRLT